MCDHSDSPFKEKQDKYYYKHIIECWNASNSSCLMLSKTRNYNYLEEYKAKYDDIKFLMGLQLRGNESLPCFCLFCYNPDKKGTIKQMSEGSEKLHDWYSYLSFNKTTERDLNTIWKAEAETMSKEIFGTRSHKPADRFT